MKKRGPNAGGPIKGAKKSSGGGSGMKSKGSGKPAPITRNELGRKGS